MNTPSTTSTASMSSSIPRRPPDVLTFRYQHELGSALAYVPFATTHEEAQEIAARAFPTLLATVDPSWLFFTVAIRYKSTGERKEIGISPNAWYYVTSKLVPYRVLDVHVVPPSMPSPAGSGAKSYAPLYPDTPAKQAAPPYPEPAEPAAPAQKGKGKGDADADEDEDENASPAYPDSPPPRYPGSPKKLHPYLAPAGYGYGVGWHGGRHDREGEDYPEPQLYRHRPRTARNRDHNRDPYLSDQEMADRRSAGWSGSSVDLSSRRWNGRSLLSSIRQRIFPITWSESRRTRGSRQSRHPRFRLPDYEREDEDEYENANGKGRSYVPSLI